MPGMFVVSEIFEHMKCLNYLGCLKSLVNLKFLECLV